MSEEFNDIMTKLGWSEKELVKHLQVFYQRRINNRERNRKYFQEHKKELYEYHRRWRINKK
jgi:hypothetical protein